MSCMARIASRSPRLATRYRGTVIGPVGDQPLGGVPAPRRRVSLVEIAGCVIDDGAVVARKGRSRRVPVRMVQSDVDRAEPARRVPERRPSTGCVQSTKIAPDVGWDVHGEVRLVLLTLDGVDALADPATTIIRPDTRDHGRHT